MGRVKAQFGGVYRRCKCAKKSCPHPWYYRLRHRGQEVRKMVGPGRECERIAWEKLREIQVRLAREEHLGVRTVGRATLAEFWPRVDAEYRARLRPSAFRALEYRTRVAAGFLTERMDAVTPGRVREFLRFLGRRRRPKGEPDAFRTVKPATRNRYLDALSTAFSFAVTEGFATTNPVAEVPREAEARTAPPRVSRADLEAIVARLAPALRPLVRLVFDTGLRRSEALGLEWRDIELDARTLVVRRAKGGKFRVVPLNAHALEVVRGLARGRVAPLRGEDPVFAGLGKPDDITRAVSSAAVAANLPGVTLHKIRAAFVTGLLERGVGASVVRDLAGHSSVAVTDRYSAASPSDAMREAVSRVENAQERAPVRRRRRVS